MDRIDPPAGDIVTAFETAVTVEEQLAVLSACYRVEPIPADHSFEDDAVYFVVGGRRNYLIRTLTPAIVDGHLHFHAWPGGTPMRPLACDRLAAAVALRRILQVHPKPADMAERDQILDVGGFSQLVEAAQRSGLVPGVATIIQVRDCEFRLGKHAQALQLMESLLQAFVVKAGQRTQQLAREDQEIASGRLKISPRELQAKRARDRQQTQAIEQARTRFMRVVEGLRTIVQRGL